MIRLVWLPMLLYVAWVVHRAHTELHDAYVIEGLFRTYQPPSELPQGALIDARPGALLAEIQARYQSERPPGNPSTLKPFLASDGASFADWQARLSALGISTRPATGPGPTPRLLFVEAGPWLQTGFFQGQPTVFDPAQGVLLLAEGALAPEVPALELLDVHERPW